ncbi:hypothetical protein K1719_037776 [Acacia pycnantha]|nr:hypothetical protein K1719_037776 [Acacia pycnantha]
MNSIAYAWTESYLDKRECGRCKVMTTKLPVPNSVSCEWIEKLVISHLLFRAILDVDRWQALSPLAYHFDKGTGSGINNWFIHFEGGGWCNNVTTCLAQKSTRIGSSEEMAKQVAFSGIPSNKENFNPVGIESRLGILTGHYSVAILSGCSAGGLTSILHCDRFRALVPASTKEKCLSDAGYFI